MAHLKREIQLNEVKERIALWSLLSYLGFFAAVGLLLIAKKLSISELLNISRISLAPGIIYCKTSLAYFILYDPKALPNHRQKTLIQVWMYQAAVSFGTIISAIFLFFCKLDIISGVSEEVLLNILCFLIAILGGAFAELIFLYFFADEINWVLSISNRSKIDDAISQSLTNMKSILGDETFYTAGKEIIEKIINDKLNNHESPPK
jgi:hypothetical protein